MSKVKQLFYFVEQFFDTMLSLGIAAARFPQAFYRVPVVPLQPVFVFGNGPSSEAAVAALLPFRDQILVGCVNDFYRRDVFLQLKPDFYIISDPMYWLPETVDTYGVPLRAMLREVDWPMAFFMPFEGRKGFQGTGAHSASVTVYPYNRTNAWGFTPAKRLFYRLGLGMPRPQNVLVAALFLLLKGGARRVYLTGAEHTWHQTLHLAENNVLHVIHANGGDTAEKFVPFYKVEGKEVFTVPEIFAAWAAVHESYHDLNAWASDLGAKVENMTPNTFIDAFPRTSIERVLAAGVGGGEC
jgi:hypothetical protein